ncbi:MAG TPA: hypothetical protein VGR38_12430, partial [Candidatus Polarisedimenticolia bacterium]|nr:hypothetical protein [Candidatus Polarisedimenticolia bacterium]
MARTRTPRNLASRVDLHYFQRPHPFRTAKRSATIAALALAIGWPLLSAALKNKDLYTSGPLAISHAILERNCSACHTGPVAGAGARGSRKAEGERAFFRRHASAAACLLCHAAAGHHEGRAAVAAASVDCADCHREHGGRRELRRVADGGCTQCHANLRTQGEPSFVREITRFRNGGHPEIALLRLKRKDSASIRFNHRAHLEKDVARPEGTVQLVCDDCHRPESDGRPWRFGEGDLQSEGQDAALARTLEAAYMAPVRYREHCSACHTLEFDPRHAGVKSPHDRMEVVHEFLLGYYRAAAGGASVRSRTNRDTPEPRRRGRAGDRARLLPREAGVAIEVESAETLL